jgi:hypothetical protein
MTLAQIGIVIPFTVIAQPATTRSNCSKATSENTTTAMVVNGFKGELHYVHQGRIAAGSRVAGPNECKLRGYPVRWRSHAHGEFP